MIGLEENLVLYCMGNRDYCVMDGMQNCVCNRGNIDVFCCVKYLVYCIGKLFTGLRLDRFCVQFVLQLGYQGIGGMVGKCCYECIDQCIQFLVGVG